MTAAIDAHAGLLGASVAAARYAVTTPGKRVRGLLTLAAFRACGGRGDATQVAAALEIVHAYSLVHDDLPCMDDDVMRRGQPTVHVVHGVKGATIAGVAMVPLAVKTIVSGCARLGLSDARQRRVAARLMQASGGGGMVGGQLLDLHAEGGSLSAAELEVIHRGKTGSLIAAATAIGGMAAGASEASVDALDRFGAAIGLAFQVMDDVLDVTSTTSALGKTAGRDTELRKSTYPGTIGLSAARALADLLVDQGRSALRDAKLLTSDLERFATFVVERAS